MGASAVALLLRDRAGPEAQRVVVDARGGADYRRLADAVQRAPAASVILVRPGLHEVDGGMRPARDVSIIGDGPGTVVRLRAGRNANVFHITSPGVRIEALRIDANGRNQQLASSNGVLFDGVEGGIVRNCIVEGAAGYNIVGFPGCTGLLIVGNRSELARKEGIELQGCSHCIVEGNIVRDCTLNGLLLWNSTGDCGFNTVRANTVSGSGGYGLLIQDGAHDNAIVGNVLRRSRLGGVALDGSSSAGTSSAADAPHNVVSGNVISNSGGHGISVATVSAAAVHGNVVGDSELSGLHARLARYCTVTGNILQRSGGPGLDLQGDGIVARGNVCRGNGIRDGRASDRAEATIRRGTRAAVTANAFSAGSATSASLWIGPSDGASVASNVVANGIVSGPGAGSVSGAVRLVRARVGAGDTRIRHGLAYPPTTVLARPLGDADIWVAGRATADHIVLRASSPVDAEIMLG